MSRRTPAWATDASLAFLAAIWGVNFAVVKVVLDELDPLVFNAVRFPLAAAMLGLAVALRRGPLLPDRRDIAPIVALGLLGNVAYQLCFIVGLDWTQAGNASLLLSTTPGWTVLLSAALGHERPTRWVWFGVGATLVGMALVVLGRGETISLGSQTLRGDLLMVAASILWSVYTVAGRGPLARYGALRVTTWALWVGTPVLVAVGVPGAVRTDFSAVSAGAWLGVLYAGLLAIGLAYLLWYRGVRRLGNSRTAIYSNLVPVWALLAAWLWLGEVPTRLQLLGAAVILSGLTVARLARTPAVDAVSPPAPALSRDP